MCVCMCVSVCVSHMLGKHSVPEMYLQPLMKTLTLNHQYTCLRVTLNINNYIARAKKTPYLTFTSKRSTDIKSGHPETNPLRLVRRISTTNDKNEVRLRRNF